MIREFRKSDLNRVADIWLNVNRTAHSFIPAQYWQDHCEAVKEMIPQAEVYVFEDGDRTIQGFIGLIDDYIAGIFVCSEAQSRGIGQKLLNYVKTIKNQLCLNVYQKNARAIKFYQREDFVVQCENSDDDTSEKEYSMIWKRQYPFRSIG